MNYELKNIRNKKRYFTNANNKIKSQKTWMELQLESARMVMMNNKIYNSTSRICNLHEYFKKNPDSTIKELEIYCGKNGESNYMVSKYLKIRSECQSVIESFYTS